MWAQSTLEDEHSFGTWKKGDTDVDEGSQFITAQFITQSNAIMRENMKVWIHEIRLPYITIYVKFEV